MIQDSRDCVTFTRPVDSVLWEGQVGRSGQEVDEDAGQ